MESFSSIAHNQTRWLPVFFTWGTLVFAAIGKPSVWRSILENDESRNLLGNGGSIVTNSLKANAPHAAISILYTWFNSLFTGMALASEWSQYSVQRKGLRVSTPPKGAQRSTYMLSLPYRHAIPLVTFSGVLHWLISQSISLVVVRAYTANFDRDTSHDVVTCSYGPIAILAGFLLCHLILFYSIGVGYTRFPSGMPVAGSCSLAIAAACHYDYSAENSKVQEVSGIEYLPLQWGVIESDHHVIGHCTFSDGEVTMPRDRERYD